MSDPSQTNRAEPAGAYPAPRPAIESKVLELVRLGLKVHDIAALLKADPRAIERYYVER